MVWHQGLDIKIVLEGYVPFSFTILSLLLKMVEFMIWIISALLPLNDTLIFIEENNHGTEK
ncbi:hypothetical protein BHE86_16185 [Shigella sp. FC1655]|nr:hypothetical protein BGK50_17420 [Shigella sp. FC130]OEI94106.1 hypothetical protein BHE86_16185 [Shigella sp. FC1655]OEJ05518.1 hypothetical protein BHE89_07100 [Shigella sp. FC1967]